MKLITRRILLAAAGGTVAAGAVARKPLAATTGPLPGPALPGLVLTDPPEPPPDIVFTTADGAEHHLSEFIGRGMVVNLWATWCVPCVAEMPALDRLSAILAPDDIAVMPLSSDRGGARVVEKFYAEHKITRLPVLLDPKGAAARAWSARGIPTTLIIDRRGRTRGRLEGAAEWADAADLVRKLVG